MSPAVKKFVDIYRRKFHTSLFIIFNLIGFCMLKSKIIVISLVMVQFINMLAYIIYIWG